MKLMIADDDEALTVFLKAHLERLGHTVDAASNGKDALDLLRRNSYDAALLDHGMPELTGLEIIQQVKKEGRSMRIIMLTGDPGMAEALARKMGADDYVAKPFLFDDITRAIEKAGK